ncbi:hypothetical protein HPO96_28085 [Kribbella sandramycini]|uniref:PH (Pleckstrin Homology) domain-containing protein n=1 Tax=Kribbella sandramycini TaxID=60450 RepID=A0A7Y4L4F7_9ACTN|nr:hypothetical protein [Kribbella sandramycini]MBB6571462.1 hypothetical protein [Kribbella sandramycini]NOL44113.1 hypothetical protein [Kribbella sandramycini]
MPTMGDQSPEAWTAELEGTGRVEFPLRRKPFGLRGLVFLLILSPTFISSSTRISTETGFGFAINLVAFIAYLSGLCFVAGCLILRRPLVAVDTEGLQIGRQRLPWSDFGTTGFPTGPLPVRTLPIIPADAWANHLHVAQDNVRDLAAFAGWLGVQHKTHTAAPPAH